MEHAVFIVNPGAGKGRGIDALQNRIRKAAEKMGQAVDLYVTKGRGDGERFAKDFTARLLARKETGRLYACGGDGTFNEVLNGVMAAERETNTATHPVAVGIVPMGTGNDFVRNFPEAGDFLDIEAQLRARAVICDAIAYEGEVEGVYQSRYCANMFNVGFDCDAADRAARLKRYPLVIGPVAYLLAAASLFIPKKGTDLTIEGDEEVLHDGPLLFTAIANGSFCGGGIHNAPQADLHDGKMDVNIIQNVSHLQCLKLLPHYMKGTHFAQPGIEKVLQVKACRTVDMIPRAGQMRLCVDGEIFSAGTIRFRIEPEAFAFLVP